MSETFKAVGYFHGNGIAFESADLLEVRELCDLHAVNPDFPSEAPCAKRRAFPVILNKADVVLVRVDADRAQAAQIELLDIIRRGLHEHLKLVIELGSIGILAVAAVSRTTAALHVTRTPRVGAQGTKRSGRGVRSRTHLVIVRLQHNATEVGPVALLGQDEYLEAERVGLAA